MKEVSNNVDYIEGVKCHQFIDKERKVKRGEEARPMSHRAKMN
jgi:hypothetical protein